MRRNLLENGAHACRILVFAALKAAPPKRAFRRHGDGLGRSPRSADPPIRASWCLGGAGAAETRALAPGGAGTVGNNQRGTYCVARARDGPHMRRIRAGLVLIYEKAYVFADHSLERLNAKPLNETP